MKSSQLSGERSGERDIPVFSFSSPATHPRCDMTCEQTVDRSAHGSAVGLQRNVLMRARLHRYQLHH